jgi:hypothetical protein
MGCLSFRLAVLAVTDPELVTRGLSWARATLLTLPITSMVSSSYVVTVSRELVGETVGHSSRRCAPPKQLPTPA